MGAGGSENPNESYKLGAGGVLLPKSSCSASHSSQVGSSVVFGFLKAAVDEIPKETIELTTGTFREADSLAPSYWEFVWPQLDKGVPVDRTRMPYVPDDPDEQDRMDSMLDVNQNLWTVRMHKDPAPWHLPLAFACHLSQSSNSSSWSLHVFGTLSQVWSNEPLQLFE